MELDLTNLYRALFNDLGVDKYTTAYVLNRLKNEGFKVVTTLLPAFGKHVLRCIEEGKWTAFSTSVRTRRGLPRIFQGYLRGLFHPSQNGEILLRDDADPISLWVIRQACEYCFKLSLPFDDSQLSQACEKFIKDDSEVPASGEYDTKFVDSMRRNLETYYPSVCRITETDVASEARPGPGTYSTAKGEWYFRNYLPATVPPEARGLGQGLRFNKHAPSPKVSVGDPNYSEVLFVPKDSRGPRVIVREPYNKLVFQMGYNSCLSAALERDTNNRINFGDQGVNRTLAKFSSTTRSYATLDLKDASDRVSYAIVRHLYRFLPLSKLLRFRTPIAVLPDGQRVRLRKLAGMGSGYTFPTMALVIHLAICTHVSKRFGVNYRAAMNRVYVYGDDIIVPTDWYGAACEALHQVGLTVNLSKSYRRSFFRESCGGDYYFGNDVGPARLRLQNAKASCRGTSLVIGNRDFGILALERHARELYKHQLHSVRDYLYKCLETETGPLPLVCGDSPILGRYSTREAVLATLEVDEVGNYVHRSVLVVKPVEKTMRDMCPYRYLLRAFGKVAFHPWVRELFPGGSRSIFGRVTVPRRIKLVRRKVSCFALT